LHSKRGLNKKQLLSKRLFDLFFSFFGVFFLSLPILVFFILATISTRKFGLYTQKRVGQYGKFFTMFKIRTMNGEENGNYITKLNDTRITSFGRFLRKFKLDEIPQIFNVLFGMMSFVGPRPDVQGYADLLQGEDRIILSVKPGITGPATLKFKDEESLLEKQENPKQYNDEVIWKEKVEINKKYIENWTFIGDIKYILKTIFS
jgi:lipopolysaccharide/colanic/teichoic acid biosynthesis glycosyltransferase